MKPVSSGWFLATVLLLGSFASPRTTAQTDAAHVAYRRGYQLLEQAERLTDAAERQAALEAAHQQFTTAISLNPAHDRAHGLLAQTLLGLMRETRDDALALALARAADQHFDRAARLREVEHLLTEVAPREGLATNRHALRRCWSRSWPNRPGITGRVTFTPRR